METINKLTSTVTSKLPTGKSQARSTNVFTGETLKEYSYISDDEACKRIEESWKSFQKYRKTTPTERSKRLTKLADILEKNIDRFARTITIETGKPIEESRSEISATIDECFYLAKHAEEFTKRQYVESDAKVGYIRFDPMGVIFNVTPFDFPSRLLFRSTLSALLMGNTVINKSSPICPQVGIDSEEALREAGWSNGEFMNLLLSKSQSELFIKSPYVRAVSFTGSTEKGSKIAELAGKYVKKTILELGGSDPFIVLKDADIDRAVKSGLKSRLCNSGQCATSAKRFFIDESVYGQFKDKLIQKLSEVKMGDPMDKSTTLGPIAKRSNFETLKDQCERAKKSGDKLLYGGETPKDPSLSKSTFFMPTVFEVTEKSPLLTEETYGPIFALMKFRDESDIARLANCSQYGLGSTIFSKDESRAEDLAGEIEAGVVYINHYMSWDVKMPEGGFKCSGYGRDGGKDGCHEFSNIKTVWVGY
jgi:succinate-semialdehyde dehydrogenase/glutarate-semialdehyde dehydrogenase